MDSKKMYISAEEITEITGMGRSSAFAAVAKMNKELEAMGKYIVRGKVPRRFFQEKFYL